MRRPPRGLTTALASQVLLVGACGGGEPARTGAADGDSIAGTYDSIAGTYNCGPEQETGQPLEVWELREDGTLTITAEGSEDSEPLETDWSADGDRVVIHLPDSDDPFNVEGDRLVSAGPPGPDGRWVCTRAS